MRTTTKLLLSTGAGALAALVSCADTSEAVAPNTDDSVRLDAGADALLTPDACQGDPDACVPDPCAAVEFWDLTNRQDWHACELQQRGTASPAFRAGRYANNEASVHAFDLMCADRYLGDAFASRRTVREDYRTSRAS